MWNKNAKKSFIALMLASLLLLSLLPTAFASNGAAFQSIQMSVSCNAGTALVGESYVLTATFINVFPIVNGSVAFSVNGSYLGTASVSDNSASIRWTPSSASTYHISAVYTTEDGDTLGLASCYVSVQAAGRNPSIDNNHQQRNTPPVQPNTENQDNVTNEQNNNQPNQPTENNDNKQQNDIEVDSKTETDVDAILNTLNDQNNNNDNNDQQQNTSNDLPNDGDGSLEGDDSTNTNKGTIQTDARLTPNNEGTNGGDGNNGENTNAKNTNGDNPDGDNPDGDNPDGDNPDGDNPDGDNPDGDNPDGDNPDGDNPDGDNPDGDNPDGDNPDGDNPDGDNGDNDLIDTPNEMDANIMTPMVAMLFDATALGIAADYQMKLSLVDKSDGKITLVATITGATPDSGKVIFYANSLQLSGKTDVIGGKASYNWTMPYDGYYTFTAEYTAVDNKTYSISLSVRNINGRTDSIGHTMPISGTYRVSLALQNGHLNTNAILTATVTTTGFGANITNGSADFYIDGVMLQSGVWVNNLGKATFTWMPIPDGYHTFSVIYRHANGEIATNFLSVYVRNGIVSNTDGWDDWYDWNDWRYISPRTPNIAMDITTKVSGTSATFTVALSPKGYMGMNASIWDTVPWYGNNYGQSNWYGFNPYNHSSGYSAWVAPDGSSYGWVPTWDRAWGPIPTGYVSFFRGNTFLGTASLVNGVATFNWSKIPAGTHTIRVTYMGDHSYPTLTENTTVTIKGSTSTSKSTPKPTSRVLTVPSSSTIAPTAVVNARLRNASGLLQENYDLQAITMLDSNITVETTKMLDQYRYSISLPEMRRLARVGDGNLLLTTPLFTCNVPFAIANNLTDLAGYLQRNQLSESQVELRVDIEPIVNVELNNAYKNANPNSNAEPTFYRIEVGLCNAVTGTKLDYNPGKIETPLMLIVPLSNATKAQRYDEQLSAFSPATLTLSGKGPVLTVDQNGVYVLTD